MALIQAEIWDGFCPEGSRGFNPFDTLTLAQGNPGVSTHKRQDNCEALRWANGFVPEGQHDRSQARSAWNHEENSSVPAGRLNRSHRSQTFQQEYLAFLKRQEHSTRCRLLMPGLISTTISVELTMTSAVPRGTGASMHR